MTLHLTPDALRATYDMLAELPPFNTWNLPSSDDLTFKVTREKGGFGWLQTCAGTTPKIGISNQSIGHTINLVMTMAHEMIHLHQYRLGLPQTHGKVFAAFRDEVCRYHGFDPKGF